MKRIYTDVYNQYRAYNYSCLEQGYDWFREANNLKQAIKKAFLSEDERGKVHSHQARVGRQRLALAAEIALERFDILSESNFDNFHSIYQFVQSVGAEVSGFGQLATYDVALRIAKYLGYEPERVYLHAGITIGARAMGFDIKDGETIPTSQFPAPFNQLRADHLENLLCTYKGTLADTSAKTNTSCVHLKANSCYSRITLVKSSN